jgi:hypothetical protein
MTDRDHWDLRGPVYTCRLERTRYLRRCGADVDGDFKVSSRERRALAYF